MVLLRTVVDGSDKSEEARYIAFHVRARAVPLSLIRISSDCQSVGVHVGAAMASASASAVIFH